MTQLATRLGKSVARTLSRLFKRDEQPLGMDLDLPLPEADDAEPDLVLLDRILTVVVRRPGQQEDFNLLTEQMSTDCIMFKSPTPLKIDEELLVQLLIFRGHMLTVPGRVNWVMNTEQGFTGQVDLCATAEQKEQLREFLRCASRHYQI